MRGAGVARAFNVRGAVSAPDESFAAQQTAPLLTRLCSEFMLGAKVLTRFITRSGTRDGKYDATWKA